MSLSGLPSVLLMPLEARLLMTGAPDGSFGQDLTGDGIPDGMLLTNILRIGGSSSSDTGMAVTTLANGKVLVAGQAQLGAAGISAGLTVARYNVNGTLDQSFGQDLNGDGTRDGIAHILPGGFASGVFGASDLTLLPDGSILLIGTALGDGVNLPSFSYDQNFALVHLTADGQLDTSFGNNGIVVTDFSVGGPGIDRALSVTLDTSNRIVVGGIGANNDAVLARYNLAGQLDFTFGTNGKVALSFGQKAQIEKVMASPDGRIVALIDRTTDFGVARLNSNGSRDSSFGVDSTGDGVPDGVSFFSYKPPLKNDALLDAGSAALLGDGSVLVAGTMGNAFAGIADQMFVAKITGSGGVDTSFGQDILNDGTRDGIALVDFGGPSMGRSIAVQSDSKIIIGGQANRAGGDRTALARFNSDGSVDPFFGEGNGQVILDFGAPAKVSGAFDLAIDGDQRLLVAGVATGGNAKDFALARLFTDFTSPNQDSDGDGILDAIESGVNANGDGNGDNIPDRLQGAVASLPDVLGNYITLEVNGMPGTGVMFGNISVAMPQEPNSLATPMGVVAYDVVGLAPGAHAMVTLHLHLSVDANAYVKFTGGPGQPQPHFFAMNLTAQNREGGEVFDDTGDGLIDRVVIETTDGGVADEDGVANGVVRNTGGPALIDNVIPAVSGQVRLDENFDGVADPTDAALANWVVFLDLNGNGVLDNPVSGDGTADANATEPFGITNANGQYAINGLGYGDYDVTVQLQPGFTVLPAAGGEVRPVTLDNANPTAAEDFAVRDLNTISGDDFNCDGIPDFLQPHVASTAPDAMGRFVTIDAMPGATVRSLSITQPPGTPPPNGVTLPFGQVNFEVGDANFDDQGHAVVKMILHGMPTVSTYFKFDTAANGWMVFEFEGEDGAVVGPFDPATGKSMLTLLIPDGGAGDNDGIPNGDITHVGGPANDRPIARISGPNSANEGQVVTLSAAGTTHPTQPLSQLNFAWDLDGDGDYDDANGLSPTVVVTRTPASAFRTYGVRVTDAEGDTSTATKVIQVGQLAPNAEAGGPYTTSEGNDVQLNALVGTTHPVQPVNSLIFEWDFDGDGQYDDAVGGTPIFTAPPVPQGTRVFVYLRVTDADGDTSFDFATVTVGDARPKADAGGPYTVLEGQTDTFSALGSSHPTQSVNSLTFEWDLDNDGQFDDAVGPTPSFVAPFVTSNTSSTVRVKVTDSDGDSDTDTATVTVINIGPTAHAGGPYEVNEGDSIPLDATLSSHLTQPADTLDYAWDLDNDGQFDDAFGATPTFTAPQVNGDTGVPLYVKVTDADGDTSTAFGFLTIRNVFFTPPPTVDAGGPYNVGESLGVTLMATGMAHPSQPQDPVVFTWDLDGDGIFGETGPAAANGNEVGATPTFAANNYDGPSDVVVTVRGRDANGSQATDTAMIHVFNRPPVPEAGGPYFVMQGLSIPLSGSATDPFPGDTITLTWDLDGDGIFGETGGNATRGNETGANPTFLSTGLLPGQSVTVTLRAADDDGGVGTDTATVTIQGEIGGQVLAFAASDFEKVFGSLDLTTGNFTTIGVIEDSDGLLFDDVEALAVDPFTNLIYSINRGNQLIVIDPTTGIGTVVGNPGLMDVDAMAFNPLTGVLYASDSTAATRPGVLYTIDTATGAATLVTQLINPDPDGLIPLNPIDPKIDGMAFHPDTGVLFGAYSSAGSPSFTVTIDLADGQMYNVGPANVGDIEDIAFTPDGRLYGVIGDEGFLGPMGVPGSFEGLVEIDSATGGAVAIGAFPPDPFTPGGVWDMEGLAILSISVGSGPSVAARQEAQPAPTPVTASLGPITASIAAGDVTVTGDDTLRFSVTWSAADGIDPSTLGDKDIRLVGKKLKQYAKFVETVDHGDGSVTATYEVTGPRKGWAAKYAGGCRIDAVGRSVRDALGQTFRRTQALTAFDLNVTTTLAFGPYTLSLTATGKLEGTNPLRFTATVSGPLVQASWLDALEARVSGPGGKSPLTLVETQQIDLNTVQATFELAAPPGGWTGNHLGAYTLEARGAKSSLLGLFNKFAPLAGVVVGA